MEGSQLELRMEDIPELSFRFRSLEGSHFREEEGNSEYRMEDIPLRWMEDIPCQVLLRLVGSFLSLRCSSEDFL